jgi:DNA-binding transcriptional regulator YiaG
VFSKKITPELCKRMRKQAGLSQEAFGIKMGWSKRTVITRESVEFKLSLSDFEKFILVTTTSPEEATEKTKILKQMGDLVDSMLLVENKKSTS